MHSGVLHSAPEPVHVYLTEPRFNVDMGSCATAAVEAASPFLHSSEDAGDGSSAGARVCLVHLQLDAPRAQLAWAGGFHRRAKAPATFNTSPPESLKKLPGLASVIFEDRRGDGCPHNPS